MCEFPVGSRVIDRHSGNIGAVFEVAPLGVYVQFRDDQEFYPFPCQGLSLSPGQPASPES